MTRPLLVALLVAVPAVAAPLPDAERERLAFHRLYGTWADPTGENAFRADGLQLRVRLPGAPHRVNYSFPQARVVSRFVRRVEGDFTAVVRVACPTLADGVVDDRRILAGGLMAVDSAGAHGAVWRSEMGDANHRIHFGAQWMNEKGGGGQGSGQRGAAGRAWVRLTRTGPIMTYGWGWDGKELADGGPEQVGWVGSVEVGIIAENTTGVPAEVSFDSYTITQPGNAP